MIYYETSLNKFIEWDPIKRPVPYIFANKSDIQSYCATHKLTTKDFKSNSIRVQLIYDAHKPIGHIMPSTLNVFYQTSYMQKDRSKLSPIINTKLSIDTYLRSQCPNIHNILNNIFQSPGHLIHFINWLSEAYQSQDNHLNKPGWIISTEQPCTGKSYFAETILLPIWGRPNISIIPPSHINSKKFIKNQNLFVYEDTLKISNLLHSMSKVKNMIVFSNSVPSITTAVSSQAPLSSFMNISYSTTSTSTSYFTAPPDSEIYAFADLLALLQVDARQAKQII